MEQQQELTVLYIPDIGETGGATKSLLKLVSCLKKRCPVIPIIFTSKKGMVYNYCSTNDIDHYAIGYKAFYISKGSTWLRYTIKTLLYPYYWIRYRLCDRQALRKAEEAYDFNKVDLIHTNVNRNSLGANLAKKYDIPHIWHIREFGDLDYNCRSLRKDYISFMNETTTAFIAISNAVAEHWIEKGLDRSKMHVIYNGVGTEWGENKCFPDADPNKMRIVFAGSLSETKGQYQLIQAIAALPEEDKQKLQVDILGDGVKEYVFYLRKKISKYGLGNIVQLRGYCTNVQAYLPSYDIGVMCSRSEGFGRVTAEYMMAGLCVIASDTGANPELIQDGENGLLYRYGDIESLKACIQTAMHDAAYRKKLGDAAKKRAQKNYAAESNAQRVYALYRDIVSTK